MLTLHSAQMHSAEVSSLLLSENSTECLSYGCKPHLRRGSIILRNASGDWFSNPFLFFCLVSPHCLLQLISLSCYLSQWRRHVQPPTPQKLFSLLSLICSYHHDFASNWVREHRNSCSSLIERIINILGIPSLTLNKKNLHGSGSFLTLAILLPADAEFRIAPSIYREELKHGWALNAFQENNSNDCEKMQLWQLWLAKNIQREKSPCLSQLQQCNTFQHNEQKIGMKEVLINIIHCCHCGIIFVWTRMWLCRDLTEKLDDAGFWSRSQPVSSLSLVFSLFLLLFLLLL